MGGSAPDVPAASDAAELERALGRVLDVESISRVKYAYLRCLDQKDWTGLAELLTADAVATYSGGRYTYEGRDAILGFLERNMGREGFHSSHRAHHPEIDLDGDVATGVWALEDTVLDTDWNVLIFGAAFYDDEYRCEEVSGERRWRISRTGYRRSFEAMVPTSEVPNLRLTASWWSTDGQSTLPVN